MKLAVAVSISSHDFSFVVEFTLSRTTVLYIAQFECEVCSRGAGNITYEDTGQHPWPKRVSNHDLRKLAAKTFASDHVATGIGINTIYFPN